MQKFRKILWSLLAISLALVGCASVPPIDSFEGDDYKFTGQALVEINDARTGGAPESKIDTVMGVGQRIDSQIIKPPALDSFKNRFHEALAEQNHTRTVSEIVAINGFDVAFVKERGAAVNVAGDPGVRGAMGGTGAYGPAAILIVQLFEQARSDAKANSVIATVVKLNVRNHVLSCEGQAYTGDNGHSAALQRSVKNAAVSCAGKFIEFVNLSFAQEKSKSEK